MSRATWRQNKTRDGDIVLKAQIISSFEIDLEVVRDFTMLSRRRLLSLYECVISCEQNDVEGDYVECGVWKGGAVGLMALANLRYGRAKRHLHLFDSFEGIPEPDEASTADERLMRHEGSALILWAD